MHIHPKKLNEPVPPLADVEHQQLLRRNNILHAFIVVQNLLLHLCIKAPAKVFFYGMVNGADGMIAYNFSPNMYVSSHFERGPSNPFLTTFALRISTEQSMVDLMLFSHEAGSRVVCSARQDNRERVCWTKRPQNSAHKNEFGMGVRSVQLFWVHCRGIAQSGSIASK